MSRVQWHVEHIVDRLSGEMRPMILYVLLGLLSFAIVVDVVWRLASRRFSLPCPTWLRWLVEIDNPWAINSTHSIIPLLDLRSGMKVLDVGCGPGRLSVPIAREVGPEGRVVAIDMQPGMLQRAKERALREKISNIEFLQIGAGEGNLGGGLYDRAILVTVLGEIPDRDGALKEIFAALKPGGLLSITETIMDPHFQRRNVVLQLAAAAGFVERDFFGNLIWYTLLLAKAEAR